jgi:hypothetical protein
MRALACVLAAAAAFTGVAFADTMENAIGNTITATNERGESATYHFNADHTFTKTAEGSEVSGVWAIADGQLCLTLQGAAQTCAPYQADKNVGDTWTQPSSAGGQLTIALTAGR